MSMAYIAGKTAFLPMDPYEVEQFLYDLGLDAPGAEHSFDVIDGVRGFPVDWGTDFRLMNRLFQRISDLGDIRDALKAWCCAQDRCTAADALKASYHMGSIMFFPGVGSDEALGELALANGMFEDYNALPEDIYSALDKAKAGARMREQDGGRFVDGGYLVVNEDFSGEPLPAGEPAAYFQARFSDGQHDSGWCDVPLCAEDDSRIAAMLERYPGLEMGCRSMIPKLNEIAFGATDLPELCALTAKLNGMSGEEIQKYKALLEVVQPGTPSAALRLAGDMGQYRVELGYADPAAYGRLWASGLAADNPLLDFIDYAGYGAAMLREHGFTATRYGAVKLGPKLEQANENIHVSRVFRCEATNGYPTVLCVDWDEEYAWLEPAPAYDDGSAEAEACREACRVWGLRGCPDWQEYNNLAQWLGEEAYRAAAVSMGDQAMGGMGGMA